MQPGLIGCGCTIPDEVGVVAELVHRARAPRRRRRTHPLLALRHRRPFGAAPCAATATAALAERLHPLSGVLVHARRGATEHVEKLGRVRRGDGENVVLGAAALDAFEGAQSSGSRARPG